jgi:hypothetical protein
MNYFIEVGDSVGQKIEMVLIRYLLFSSDRWAEGAQLHQEGGQPVPVSALRPLFQGQEQPRQAPQEKVGRRF